MRFGLFISSGAPHPQQTMGAAMADILDMEYINSLPQPFMAKLYGTWWGVECICVQTGLVRLDICGLPQVEHFDEFSCFRDDCGNEHDPDDFYLDGERATTATKELKP